MSHFRAGLNHDGRVMLVRSGLVVSELARLEHEGLLGVWTVRAGKGAAAKAFIVFSFLTETRAMGVAEEIDEV